MFKSESTLKRAHQPNTRPRIPMKTTTSV